MKDYGLKLIVLALLSTVAMDTYAADALAGIHSDLWAFFWDKKLYIPLGIVVFGVYFRVGR